MPDIEHSIEIAAKLQTVYPLVSTANGFARWWAMDTTERDGTVELGFFNRTTVYRLQLVADRPPLEAEWLCGTGDEWNGTRLRFRLEETKSGTLLRFIHADWRARSNYFVSCTTTWGALMFRLKAAAEGQTPGPLFLADSMAY